MKIITGYLKHRNIIIPSEREKIRTTTSQCKKAIVDIFQAQIANTVILDLFAGSGGVGIELLSNYAKKVVFVEKNFKHIQIIKKNLTNLIIDENFYLILNKFVDKALQFLNNKFIFNFIFLDPPYKENLVTATIQNISKTNIYDNTTIIIAEHHVKEITPENINKFIKYDSRNYGLTSLDFYQII